MKILVTSAGSRGDVYPLIYLGRELNNRGHEIRFASSPNYREVCEKEGFIFFPIGTDFRCLMNNFSHNMGKPLKIMTEGIAVLNQELQAFFDGTLKAADGAHLLISSGLQLTSMSIAEVLGIPYRCTVHIPVLTPSKYHPPFFVPFQNLPHWLNRILWTGNNFFTRITVEKTLNRIRADIGLDPKRNIIDHINPTKLVVAVSSELGCIAPDNQDIGLQTDYFFNPNEGELSHEMKQFLENGEPPVYFGFGSMTDGSAEKTLSVIFGAVKELGIRAVISRGWANYTHGDIPCEIYLADEEPHGKLFPKMRAIVHHGGAGTTSNAARAGIPQITAPHVLDQFYWTKRISTLGIGPGGINKRKLTIANLVEKLRIALEDESITLSAKKLGEKLKNRNGIFEFADKIENEIL